MLSLSGGCDMDSSADREAIASWYRALQAEFCARVETLDAISSFREDAWERPGGGGGLTRILEGDGPIEKAAVNWSGVWGETPPRLSERLAGPRFYATGISIIIHPRNPHAPTFHANLRYLEAGEDRWFGGGADLTPYYLYEEDVATFHRELWAICQRHPVADYSAWKRDCDDYFYLRHRGEARGVGGVFFDHLTRRLSEVWEFHQDLGNGLSGLYLPILERRMHLPYTADEEVWHLRRRGRYAEFNLVWDRGTRFGLETSGRTESILASLPPRARWDYQDQPEPGTPEARMVELLRGDPRDWVGGGS